MLLLLGASSVFAYAIHRRYGGEFLGILNVIFSIQTVAVLGHAILADRRKSGPDPTCPAIEQVAKPA